LKPSARYFPPALDYPSRFLFHSSFLQPPHMSYLVYRQKLEDQSISSPLNSKRVLHSASYENHSQSQPKHNPPAALDHSHELRSDTTTICQCTTSRQQPDSFHSDDSAHQQPINSPYTCTRPWPSQEHQLDAPMALSWRCLPGLLNRVKGGGEEIFTQLFGWAIDTVWLDSSATDRGRFSYMAGRGGRLWKRITYRLPDPTEAQEAQKDASSSCPHTSDASSSCPPVVPVGIVTEEDWLGSVTYRSTPLLPYLEAVLYSHRLAVQEADAQALPFNMWGGLVGYLGYELKAECGGRMVHRSKTPDACFVLLDRLVVLDHQKV
jgi:hypothetical protein